ncbi:MAG: hypothetical protein HS100_17415 [Anaerolineales bacterium]|nr:hypothetical protein [Anaerolineales bacterium]MCE7860491.1 hypothetical protein [Chloroflexi bacterium CFX2]
MESIGSDVRISLSTAWSNGWMPWFKLLMFVKYTCMVIDTGVGEAGTEDGGNGVRGVGLFNNSCVTGG